MSGNWSSRIPVAYEPDAGEDFLLLAGGKTLVDRWAGDPRPKAWIMLGDADLNDYHEPAADYIIADRRFLGTEEVSKKFIKRFAFSISSGLAVCPGELTIPPAFTYSCRTRVIAGDGGAQPASGSGRARSCSHE